MSDIIITTQPEIDLEPWSKMPSESPRAYAAFLSYRNLPPRDRSLKAAVVSHYGVHTSAKLRQFQHWSGKNMWVDRADAWDRYSIRKIDEEHLKRIAEMNDLHAKTARGLLKKGLERLQKMSNDELTPTTVLSYILAAINIERIAMGQPSDIIKEETRNDTTVLTMELTDQELREKLIAARLNRKQ